MAFNPKALIDWNIWRAEALRLLGLVADGTGGTIIFGTFQATANGTGYSIGDILIYRQTPPAAPEYFNTATSAVVTPSGDLGPVGGSSSTVTANAGTNLNTSALALENGGNLAVIASNTAVALGAGTAAAAQRTTLASDSPGVANLAAVGASADASATSDTGTFSLIALVKRSLLRLSNIYAVLCTGTRSGGTADNAVISGTIAAPGAGQYIHFTGYSFSFSADPSAARALTITAGGVTLADIDVTTGGAGPVSISVSAPASTAVTYSLAASGTAGNIGKLSLYHTTLSVI